jgi:hypothetical protein
MNRTVLKLAAAQGASERCAGRAASKGRLSASAVRERAASTTPPGR